MGVPYTFGTATTSIPLSNLDANFNTPVTIGSTTVGLGNTTTTLAGLSNVSTTLLVATTANITTQNVTTSNLTNLTVTNDASISGLTVGKGGGAVGTNAAFGTNALNSNTTGVQNIAIGNTALFSNTTGGANAGGGYFALAYNTTGNYNTAFGHSSLQSNTTASNNTAVGYQASYSTTTGVQNVSLGARANYSVTTANSNTAVGYNANNLCVTGAENTALGLEALAKNTTASNNSAVGAYALYNNTTGTSNTALGWNCLVNNTTASNNTAIGHQAGFSNTTGDRSVYIGRQAGYTATGRANTIVGDQAGYSITTGVQNSFIGIGSGSQITTGGKNSILGAYDGNQGGLDIRTASSYIVLSDGDGNPRLIGDELGKFRMGTTSNLYGARLTVVSTGSGNVGLAVTTDDAGQQCINFRNLGTGSTRYFAYFETNSPVGGVGQITTNGTNTTYSTTSDYRLKEDVTPIQNALDVVAQLKPVNYKWKSTGTSSQGFIAHELQQFVPEAVIGKKDEVREDGTPKYQGIDTSFLVATLTAAIQELNAKLEAQALEIATLKGN
jgi:trimeric autotransporter adhesin